jgi:hypothetical protein
MLSLAPISILLDTISVNSHWSEPSYQVLRPGRYIANVSLLLIRTDPVAPQDMEVELITGIQLIFVCAPQKPQAARIL